MFLKKIDSFHIILIVFLMSFTFNEFSDFLIPFQSVLASLFFKLNNYLKRKPLIADCF